MPFTSAPVISWKYVGQPFDLNSILTPDEVWAKLDLGSEEVRTSLNSLIAALNSVTDGSSGADNVGATPLNVSSGATVQAIMEYLKSQIDGVVLGQVPDGSITSIKAPTLAKYADLLNDFVVSGTVPATSTTLTTTIPNQIAYVLGQRVDKASEDHTFTASKDTYIDLSNTASYTYVEVANAAAAPAVTANSIRLFKVVTDASAITTVTDLRTLNPKINKNAEITSDPTTALGLATKQYVDAHSRHKSFFYNAYKNIPIGPSDIASANVVYQFFPNLAAGNTTLYTVPAGKILVYHPYPAFLFNPTGAAITVTVYLVPSGGTAGATNASWYGSVAVVTDVPKLPIVA